MICSTENCNEEKYTKGMCVSHYKHQHYLENSDKIRAASRKYYRDNIEHCRKRNRLYDKLNAKDRSEYQKSYRGQHVNEHSNKRKKKIEGQQIL